MIGWPQGIYIGVNLIILGWLFATKPHAAIGATAAWALFTLPLLYWGGFFG